MEIVLLKSIDPLSTDKDAYTHYPKADDTGPPHKHHQPLRQERSYRGEEDFGPVQVNFSETTLI